MRIVQKLSISLPVGGVQRSVLHQEVHQAGGRGTQQVTAGTVSVLPRDETRQTDRQTDRETDNVEIFVYQQNSLILSRASSSRSGGRVRTSLM